MEILETRTLLAAPTLLTPAANGVITDTSPEFSWTEVAGADHYDIWVNDVTASISGIIRNQNVAGTTFTPNDPLPAGHVFQWTVRGIAADGTPDDWAIPQPRFEIGLSAPVLTAPGATTNDTTPTFQWAAVEGADHYDIWVNNRTTGQSGVIRNINVAGTSFTPTTPLTAGHEYIWTVRAIAASAQGGHWASHSLFSITNDVVPSTPAATAPDPTTNDTTPTFQWTAATGADHYDLWVNNRTTGQSGVIRNSDVAGTSFTPTTPLTAGHEYIWTVRGISAAGTPGNWASHATFTISNDVVPSTPNLTAPGSTTNDTTPTFQWTASSGADHYDIWVNNRTTGQSGVIRNPNVPGTSLTPTTSLTAGHEYIWTVRAIGASGLSSDWAAHKTFVIDASGDPGIFHSADVPKDIADNATTTSQVAVGGLTGQTSDVDVTLNISHLFVADLDVFLVSPSGTRVELFTDVGGSGNHFTNTILDDSAATAITAAAAPFTGRFRPESPLSAFNGQNPNGTWTLELSDDVQFEAGTLNSWSLTFDTGTQFVASAPPQLIAPAGTTVDTLRPTFQWSGIVGAQRYDIWVNNLTTGQSGVIRNENITGTSFTAPFDLPNGHRFIWTVRAIGGDDAASPWASHRTFSTAVGSSSQLASNDSAESSSSELGLTPSTEAAEETTSVDGVFADWRGPIV